MTGNRRDHHGNDWDASTRVVSLGRPRREPDGSLNPAITLSSTFVGAHAPGAADRTYARFSNPSWEPLEEAMAALESSEVPGLAYASGMAAVSAVLSLVPVGGIVVVPTTSYNGTIGLARTLDADGLISLREIDPTRVDDTIAALDQAHLIWLESPTNPLLEVIDLPRIIAAARAKQVSVVVDNTFSTPLRQRPLEVGADIVVHSATKFIAGHSDVLMGLVVTRDQEVRSRLLQKRTLSGAVPGPFESWLALRGLRTLAVRLDRAEQTAGVLATRLAERAEISRVRYPGLPGDPGYALAMAQLEGTGAIISIELAGDSARTAAARAERFVDALQVFTPATSLGGVESLAERRRRQASEPDAVPESLVRLSIGIEYIDDLWADLDQALRASD